MNKGLQGDSELTGRKLDKFERNSASGSKLSKLSWRLAKVHATMKGFIRLFRKALTKS
jgi:hypothetical protein